MKKIKKIIILAVIGVLLLSVGGIVLYNVIVDENSLSISEKKWIDSNSSNVISLSIPNDIPVFGSTGEGVFFDFSSSLVNDLGLNINNNTVSYLSNIDGYGFFITDTYSQTDLLLFKDHYVLVSKNTGVINDAGVIPSLKPGILATSKDRVKEYFNNDSDFFTEYDNFTKISEDLANGTIEYALVPLNEYKDELISNNVNILKHLSDLNKFYYFHLGSDKELNSILTKQFNSWKKKKFDKSYDSNNFKLFVNMLKLSEVEQDTLTNRVYHYGFAEMRPFEVLASGEYGGITAAYLESFSNFSNVEFTYKKYKNSTELVQAALNGSIDMYYNYYNIITNYIDSGALKSINYYVIAHNSIDLSLSNINGLQYQTVYVLRNSYLADLIKNLPGINIIEYSNMSELKKIAKKENIILLDEDTYEYYLTNIINSYSVRYKGIVEDEYYSFRYKNDTDPIYKLFNAYTKTIDPNDLLRTGITTYNKVNKRGEIVGNIAVYILGSVVVLVIGFFIYRNKAKKVKLNTKVKKEDRLKYIDLLTSLKNRNYYNEKVDIWNKNTIYPQACIVMDINRVKELNDTLGHEEGDKQIQAVANVLIKTQIDNTEIIRTDGNEFMIYAIGYSEKQIVSYMKKLLKEFNKLPYDYGVPMGFSMIEDDTKLVEDAFNEASIQMRKNKGLVEDKDDKKDK